MVVRSVKKDSKKKVLVTPKSPVGGKKVRNGRKAGSPGEKAQVHVQRRTSARIQTKQREEKELMLRKSEEKELLIRKRVELLDDKEGDEGNTNKRKKATANGNITSSSGRRRRRVNLENVREEVSVKNHANGTLESSEVMKSGREAMNGDFGGLNEVVACGDASADGGLANVADKGPHANVKDTIRLFNKHYLHFVQEEETRCAKVQVNKKASRSSKSKKGNVIEVDSKKKAKRPDLKAVSKMLEDNSILNPKKRIGNLPGINVGHQFYSRAEMVVVGFHNHWLKGIDYMGMSHQKGEYSNYTFPLAVSIVISGVYEDDLDNAEDVIYTGQGGNNLTGNKRQIRDQKLIRGNLALKNCYEQCVPVRVSRGHVSTSSYSGKVYTYDGLYKVVQHWAEKGISGFTVFKYRLRRLEGQPILTTNQVFFTYGRVPESISEIRGLVCEDITGGLEDVPIPATNLVDNPPVAPSGYTYCKSMRFAKNIKPPAITTGCNCKGSCVDPRTCACAQLNGSDFPYVHRDGGRLIEAKDVVFECGPNCGCGPGCVNKTSQRGMKYRFEVFRTPKKGWAVRSWDFIPSGAPVCEYIGFLMKTEDIDNVSQNNYIFDIDCLQTMRGLGGRVRRQGDGAVPTIHNVDGPDASQPEFCIDACSIGNIARFINHSCEPNLFVQCVLSSHHDIKLARVMLFAADNIPPLQELTYDYGYALNSVTGPDGRIIKMPCYCGAADCRKRMF